MSDLGNVNHNDDQEESRQVRQAYRATAEERAPAQLDDKILGLARRELRNERWPGLLPWLRPAAFVATAGLCLAVVLQLTEPGTVGIEPAATGEQTQDPATIVGDFASAAKDSTDRIRTIGDNASARDLQGDRLPNDVLPRPESNYCTPEQTASPEEWQRCILALQQAGRSAAARIESQRLNDTYPDFPIRD